MGEDKDLAVLLTNDDGYRARGINILADYLEEISDLRIVAPKGNRSGVSHSVTFTTDLVVEERNYNERDVTITSGTPADCVNFGLETLYKGEIDLVVSGINHGRNLASDLYVSGTVAGARAAAFSPHELVGIGISAATEDGVGNFELAAEYCAAFTEWVAGCLQDEESRELFSGLYFNLNVPTSDDIKGLALTTPALDRGANGWYEESKKRFGKTYYKRRWKRPEESTEMGSDVWATQQGYCSLSVLSLENSEDRIKNLEELLLKEFSFRGHEARRF